MQHHSASASSGVAVASTGVPPSSSIAFLELSVVIMRQIIDAIPRHGVFIQFNFHVRLDATPWMHSPLGV